MAIAASRDPMMPQFFRVLRRRRELADTWTLDLEPGGDFEFLPGQFNMVYAFGIGEVPVSISGDPAQPETLVHTIRAVGRTTEALCAAEPGSEIGIRGPYGTAWPVAAAEGGDLLVIAGGIGLAPIRPALYHVFANRSKYKRVSILIGGRSPDALLYPEEIRRWRSRFDAYVDVTVDTSNSRWRGNVGVVTTLIKRAPIDPEATTAFVCGPEVMFRYAALGLAKVGVAPARTFVSMERNMKCAIGFCGHCQFGPDFVCKDGPVFAFDRIERLLRVREV